MRFGHSKKPTLETGRRRQVVGQTDRRQAFSYHTSQVMERGEEAAPERQRRLNGEIVRTQARSIFSQLPFWIVVLLAIVCAGKLVLLGTSPRVVVVGQTAASSAYVHSTQIYRVAASKLLQQSFANRFKLTLDSTGVAQKLQAQFPELETASVAVPLLGNRPIVYVALADPSLVLRTVSGNFAVNEGGVVLARLTSVPAGVVILDDQSGSSPVVGMQVLPATTVAFIRTVIYQLAAAKYTVSSVSLPKSSAYELDVQLLGQAFMTRFNLLADPKQQSGAVIAALAQLAGNLPANYIDARTPERIYYK